MSKFILSILVLAVAVLVCAYILPGAHVSDYWTAVIVAIALAFLNNVVRPVLILFTIPVTVITLGLFLLVINALIILLADWMVDGFEVDGLLWALIFSLLLTFVKSVFNVITGLNDEKPSRRS